MKTEAECKSLLTFEILSSTAVRGANFNLIEIKAAEALSQAFEYQLIVIADNSVALKDFLDHEVTFAILDGAKNPARNFNGIVASVEKLTGDVFQNNLNLNNDINLKIQGLNANECQQFQHCYQLTVKPWIDLIDRAQDCRNFIDMNVLDITVSLLKSLPYANFDPAALKQMKLPTLKFIVQYQETTWQFLTRLWRTAGINFYFSQENNKHQLILIDNLLGLPKYTGELSFETKSRPENFRALGAVKQQQAWISSSIKALSSDSYAPKLSAACVVECRQYAAKTTSDAVKQIERQRFIVTQLKFTAKDYGGIIGLGSQSKIFDPHYSFKGSFTAIRESDLAAYQQARKKSNRSKGNKVAGYQSAVVVDDHNNHSSVVSTNKFAEVKVQFPWDRYHDHEADSSCWIMHANPVAGKNWGQQWLPRIKDEVPVMFFEGDHDQPQVHGGLYHEDHSPIYNPAQHPEISGLKTRSFAIDKEVKNFHELSFHDKQGQEKVHLESAGLLEKKIKQHQNQTIQADVITTVKNQYQLNVAAGLSRAQASRSIELRVGASLISIVKGKLSIKSGAINLRAPGNSKVQPVAAIGSPHKCSKESHSGGPILSGSPTVAFNGKSAARVGDRMHCGHETDYIKHGAENVFVDGRILAVKGGETEHGGEIEGGEGGVSVGEGGG